MKNFFSRIQTICLILFLPFLSSGQASPTTIPQPFAWKCGANVLQSYHLANDTITADNFANYNASLKYISTNFVNAAPPLMQIPVVFHIIQDGNSPAPVPSYNQIQWQLATLNAAFSNSLASLNTTTAGPHADHTSIQFCFAKLVQTAGSPTVWPTANYGMINYVTTNTLITSIIINGTANSPLSLSALAALTNYTLNYPPSMYLNIFCVPDITDQINPSPSIIGIGTFPWLANPIIDGIIMRSDFIGNNTYNNFPTFVPTYKGNILAHEAGHYLGLFHTFETNISTIVPTFSTIGCYGMASAATATAEGDFIVSTPPTTYTQPNLTLINTCNEAYDAYNPTGPFIQQPDQLENFMTYLDDQYLNTFTLEQAARMWGALTTTWSAVFMSGNRFNLPDPANLAATGVTTSPSCGPGVLTSTFTGWQLPATITCSTIAMQFTVPLLPNYLSATNYTWNFGDGGTSNLPNPVHTYTFPPASYIVTLTTSDGVSSSSSTMAVNFPYAPPKIVGQSGYTINVCRGTEQTILIEFPAYASSALLTDGTNFFPITSNFGHTCSTPSGTYRYPFKFTATSNVSFSLVPASCNTLNLGVASFSVVDCCNNMVVNGDFSTISTAGFYSDYNLTTTNYQLGNAALNSPAGLPGIPNPNLVNIIGQTGSALIIDSHTSFSCSAPGSSSLLIGQAITGLKPNSTYFVSFKGNQAYDSVLNCSSNKWNIRLKYPGNNTFLDKNVLPSVSPPTTCVTYTGWGAMQVFNFVVTTPASITTATSFSLELREVDNFGMTGFDYIFDNLILTEMQPNNFITINPSSSSVCPNSTVQLTASSSCFNLNNFSISWQPTVGLSCSNCLNPIASPTANTIYTLTATPPGSLSTIAVQTVTTSVNIYSPNISVNAPVPFCNPVSYTLTSSGVPSLTWQPGGSSSMSITANTTVSTTYTVSYQGSGCLVSSTVQLHPAPTPTLFASSSTTFLCSNLTPTLALTATCTPSIAPSQFTWQPGNYTGNPAIGSPTTSTIYTLTAGGDGCGATRTVAVEVQNQCCYVDANTVPPGNYTSSVLGMSGATIAINQNITITNSVNLQGEIFFAPNVSITIANGGTLTSFGRGAHLLSCNDMWEGILVQNGGQLNLMDGSSLVEDAKRAVHMIGATNTSANSANFNIRLKYTAFNRNFVSVLIENSGANSPYLIEACVFTCRTLTASPGFWVFASTLFSPSAPANPLASPYEMIGYPPAALKAPYWVLNPLGIQISNSGVTSSPTSTNPSFVNIKIGNPSSANDFNLFDNMYFSIQASNSNVLINNGVYQNTRPWSPYNKVAGAAIASTNNGFFNGNYHSNLDLVSSAQPTLCNNKFYNCNIGVSLDRVFRANIQYAEFRSTQTKTNTSTIISHGNHGIYIYGNLFKNYVINYNKFYNIHTGIHLFSNNLPINGLGFPTFGQYWTTTNIKYNYFSPTLSPNTPAVNEYISNAIVAENTINGAKGTWVSGSNGLWIQENTLDRVYRGIEVRGFYNGNFGKYASNNSVLLVADHINTSQQWGVGCFGNVVSVANTNTITGYSTSTLIPVSGVYNSMNTNSGVKCNSVTALPKGIEFAGTNLSMVWRYNKMHSNLSRGMQLSSKGIIGQQGTTGSPSDNIWQGTAWSGSNYNTWTDQFSFASFSKLYLRTTIGYTVHNNGAPPNFINNSYAAGGTRFSANNFATIFSCYPTVPGGSGPPPSNRQMLNDIAGDTTLNDYNTEEAAEINEYLLYWELNTDSILTLESDTLQEFYDLTDPEPTGTLVQIENYLDHGDFSSAYSLLTSFSPETNIQSNFKSYYLLYHKFMTDTLSSADSLELMLLAAQCPFTDGLIIYKARTLWNLVSQGMVNYNDEACDSLGYSERRANLQSILESREERKLPSRQKINIKVFPNPASDHLTIKSNKPINRIKINITDLTGKVLIEKELSLSESRTELTFDLMNGLYFVNLVDEKGFRISKKIVVAR